MKYRFFQVPPYGGEAEEQFNRFIASCRVVSVDRQFVADGPRSMWAVCVGYVEEAAPPLTKKGKVDYRELLSPEDFGMFSKLRALRKRLADADGVPPHAVFSNEQLAQMVTGRAHSREDVQALEGVGEATRAALQRPCTTATNRRARLVCPLVRSPPAPAIEGYGKYCK